MEHDGKRIVRETALCGGENKGGARGGYGFIAADDRGVLAVGSTGTRLLVSRVDSDGQVHCPEIAGIYPASPIAEDGVWLARTGTGVEVQDETGRKSTAVELPPDAVVHGVARRGHALVHSLRPKAPWEVYWLEGRSWHATQLPVMFSYTWMSDQGVVFATSIPTISDMVTRRAAREGAPCELLARVERQTVTYIPLPPGFRPRGIAGRTETDLWLPGGEDVLHWDGTTWRQAAPSLGAAGGVVDEDGAFWFVGAGSSGAQHSSLYRVRRK